jgi:hypothetical protein
MDKNRFKDLLTDLYQKYNPEHIKYIDELVARNHDSPYAAIDSIFMKYNHHSMAHYDPVKSTDEYKIQLVKDYEAGKRTFKEVDLASEATAHKVVEEEKQVKVAQEEVKKIAGDKVSEVTSEMMEKVKELMSKESERIMQKALESAKRDEDIDYTVSMDNVGEEVVLPNKKHLSALGINTRLIVRGKESGRPIGLVIKDIAYDSFTSEKNVIVSIHLEKG